MTNRCLDLIVKDHTPVTLAPADTLRRACEAMRERSVGAALVVEEGRLAGILTGRDVVRALAEGHDPGTPLVTVMTPDPDTIAGECTAIDALRMMSDGGYRHLPIVTDGTVVGVVSRGDFKGLELDRLEEETCLWERIC
ncbi:CBS domain-containing protein [Aromatoleum aromaticum]|uniref:CBS domain-containing protein n=1 Tax=Aromatoleum aromaticum TaxID=551760 RepID=UPI00059F1BAD|nr:CBS domain-containing protein [Aromatoleum aromaticum]NMG54562.1 CBS domain-containing protein [Aromatoleum aromaticum]